MSTWFSTGLTVTQAVAAMVAGFPRSRHAPRLGRGAGEPTAHQHEVDRHRGTKLGRTGSSKLAAPPVTGSHE